MSYEGIGAMVGRVSLAGQRPYASSFLADDPFAVEKVLHHTSGCRVEMREGFLVEEVHRACMKPKRAFTRRDHLPRLVKV